MTNKPSQVETADHGRFKFKFSYSYIKKPHNNQ